MPSEKAPASDELSYEKARDQLTELVRRLEAGGLTLEQSLELWERGEQLAAICEGWLEGARARLAALAGKQETRPEAESGAEPANGDAASASRRGQPNARESRNGGERATDTDPEKPF